MRSMLDTPIRPPTVMIIERDPDIFASLVEILEVEGLRTSTIGTPLDGRPDIVLVDLADYDKATNAREAGIPVVLMGSNPDGGGKAAAIGARWLQKPFEVQELLEMLGGALASRWFNR